MVSEIRDSINNFTLKHLLIVIVFGAAFAGSIVFQIREAEKEKRQRDEKAMQVIVEFDKSRRKVVDEILREIRESRDMWQATTREVEQMKKEN